MVKVGTQRGRRGAVTARRSAPTATEPRTSTSSSAARRPTRSSSILAEFGDERRPELPRPGHRPGHARPDDASTVRCTTRSRSPTAAGQLHRLAGRLQRRTSRTCTSARRGRLGATESLKNYYEKQSSGRYSVDGEVTDWVKVPYNEARYGAATATPARGNVCSQHLGPGPRRHQRLGRRPEGRRAAPTPQIKADLSAYDQWDRYDYDGDGNFNEPDGYIDHFQIVHAGGDQADGDPPGRGRHLGAPLVRLRHRRGPAPARRATRHGGTQIGDTGIWVGDYTIQPENGGLGVFAHEYGHDLGLPDHYDTSGGGETTASTCWTLMAQSRGLGTGRPGIGDRPADLGAWDKLQLGWLDYETVLPAQNRTHRARPARVQHRQGAGRVVVLPDEAGHHRARSRRRRAPSSGGSGNGDDLDTPMTRTVDLAGRRAALTLQGACDIEDGLRLPLRRRRGRRRHAAGPPAGQRSPRPPRATASTGAPPAPGRPATVRLLDATPARRSSLRFRYPTDGGAQGKTRADAGFFADDDHRHRGRHDRVHRRRRDRRRRLDARRASRSSAHRSPTTYDNYYIASQPDVRLVRQVPQDRPVQLRLRQHEAGLGRALPVPERPADLLLGHLAVRQQHQRRTRAPGDPADRRAPDARSTASTGTPWRARVQVYDAPFSAGEGGLVHACT